MKVDNGAAQVSELEILFDIARTLDRHVELRTALGPVLSILEVRLGLKRGMVTLLDRATGLLRIEEADGLNDEEKERGIYRLGEGLVGKVFETGVSITAPDLSKESRFLNRAKNRQKSDMTNSNFFFISRDIFVSGLRFLFFI
jgi:Nif-specific regulatory protein